MEEALEQALVQRDGGAPSAFQVETPAGKALELLDKLMHGITVGAGSAACNALCVVPACLSVVRACKCVERVDVEVRVCLHASVCMCAPTILLSPYIGAFAQPPRCSSCPCAQPDMREVLEVRDAILMSGTDMCAPVRLHDQVANELGRSNLDDVEVQAALTQLLAAGGAGVRGACACVPNTAACVRS